jgi:uncharacterized protein with von Willebrand factor type A (vWA) domain
METYPPLRGSTLHLRGFVDDLGVTHVKRVDFLTALRDNPPPDLARLYWLARVTLVSRLEDIPSFDAVFATWFAGAPPIFEQPPDEEGETEAPKPRADEELAPIQLSEGTGKSASFHELRNRRSYDPTTHDLAELRKALAEHLPRRRALRRKRARRGTIDLRRTLREAIRTGEVVTLARRDRPHRARPLLILIDVSGSLRANTPDYLRFAHAAQAETFTFGTRLTRVTEDLRTPDCDTALANVSEHVVDADGGTRIGTALQEFLDTPRYADRARGALVIVLSDGLERGDPAVMTHAVERLARLSHRLVWWTPLGRDPSYRPVTRAMAAILPHLDDLAGAHDLDTLLEEVRSL